MKAPTLLAVARHRGTGSSNPFPSSGESIAKLIFGSALGLRRAQSLGRQSRARDARPTACVSAPRRDPTRKLA
jgi:hypothetical protein